MNYKFEVIGDTKFLVYTHRDNMKIYSTTLKGLIETVEAYNNIYYNEQI